MNESALSSKFKITPDGLDFHKLEQIINHGQEDDIVDFKKMLDTTKSDFKCELVKDIVSMANTYGGYIVIGYDEKTKELFHCSDELNTKLDSSKINDMVKSYSSLNIRFTKQDHFLGENKEKRIIAIFIEKSIELVVLESDGQYLDPRTKQNDFKFKNGDIFIRRNTSNRKANSQDLKQLLENMAEEKILKNKKTSENDSDLSKKLDEINNLLLSIVSTGAKPHLKNKTSKEYLHYMQSTPNFYQNIFIESRLIEEDFIEGLKTVVDKDSYRRINADFLNKNWQIIHACIISRNKELFLNLMNNLSSISIKINKDRGLIESNDLDSIQYLGEYVKLIYVTGAFLIKERLIDWVPLLVKQEKTISDKYSNDYGESYQYWNRFVFTALNRGRRLHFKSYLHETVEHAKKVPEFSSLTPDEIINFVYSFDYLFCLFVFIKEDGNASIIDYFPMFSAMYKDRYEWILEQIIIDKTLENLFPNKSIEVIIKSINSLNEESAAIAKKEGWLPMKQWKSNEIQRFLEKTN